MYSQEILSEITKEKIMDEKKNEEEGGQVSDRLTDLSTSLGQMEKEISAIEDRLLPVLVLRLPEGVLSEDKEKEAIVPLAREIENSLYHLNSLIRKLNEIRKRVEL